MNPRAILKILYRIKQVFDILRDEKKRKRVATTILVVISLFILIIALPIYLILSPITALVNLFLDGDTDSIALVSEFKDEYSSEFGFIQFDGDRAIPLYLQYDERWGSLPYAGKTIAVAGCGPSALAMVVSGLTGKQNITPDVVADFSIKNGWAIDGVGTSWELMTTGASEYGLSVATVDLNVESLMASLESGRVLIASMTQGTFTNGGHFIVLTGLTDEGFITVNDSYSTELSNMAFSPELIISECKGLWSYTYNFAYEGDLPEGL